MNLFFLSLFNDIVGIETSISDRMINNYGEVGGIRTDRGN
jgi:hypothetical protein